MSAWELPVSLDVCGTCYGIRTDFRAVLDILKYFNDPEYEPDERWEICLDILYTDYASMPLQHKQEAMGRAFWFIDMGMEDRQDGRKKPHTMDWEQDAPIILPAVNKVMGGEVRALLYLHWWTFLGAYMEIGECLFSQVLHIRQKKAKRKHLDKWENEFYLSNKALIELKGPMDQAGREAYEQEQAAVDALFGIKRR